jgi:predicted glycosyltransferase
MLTYPFVLQVQSPDCYMKDLGSKQVRYAGCHELAYLHPNRFVPDEQIVKDLGVNTSEKYCIIRLVSWGAHHDIGQHGFDDEKKIYFVEQIAKYARPYITSEAALPAELEISIENTCSSDTSFNGVCQSLCRRRGNNDK